MTLSLAVQQAFTFLKCVAEEEGPNVVACAANRMPLYNIDAYIPATTPLYVSRFACLDVGPRPWSKHWDFNGNGAIDTEDVLKKAFFSDPEVLAELWEKLPNVVVGFVLESCPTVKVSSVYEEVRWKYQTIIAETPDGANGDAAVQRLNQIEQKAVRNIAALNEGNAPKDAHLVSQIKKVTDAIREMTDDAIRILRGGSPAVFGIGVYLTPSEGSVAPYPLQISGVHTDGGAAAAGLMRGDVVMTLDGRRYDGSVSASSGTATGFTGPRDSTVRVGILRFGHPMEFTARRNICALSQPVTDFGILGARNLVFTK